MKRSTAILFFPLLQEQLFNLLKEHILQIFLAVESGASAHIFRLMKVNFASEREVEN